MYIQNGSGILLELLLLFHIQDSTSSKKLTKDGCVACDKRTCPYLVPENCQGQIVRDKCGCCPVCNEQVRMRPMVHLESHAKYHNDTIARAVCAARKCKKSEICVINIQGIPICRCPSQYWCRRQKPRKPLCGKDGRTYKSRCYLKLSECMMKKKIRILHKGACKTAIGGKYRGRDGSPGPRSAPGGKLRLKKRGSNKKRRKLERRIAKGKARHQKLRAKIKQLKEKKKNLQVKT